MDRIREDIRNNSLQRFYLLYGEEDFLKNLYREKLTAAICPDKEGINYNSYTGKDISLNEVISVSETLPFFADRRLIVINNSEWFKNTNQVADYLKDAPETSYFIFVESIADKRKSLYKFVSENGYCCEIGVQKIDYIKRSVAAALKHRKLLITESVCDYFVTKVGTDMGRVNSELDKLTAYCLEQKEVTKEDVDTICTEIPDGKIYRMIDSMMLGDSTRALELYYELVLAHEEPRSIFTRLIFSYYNFYQTLLLASEGQNKAYIVKLTGIRDFMVDKYLRLRRSVTIDKLRQIVEEGLDMDRRIKSGELNDRFAIEIFVVKFSNM